MHHSNPISEAHGVIELVTLTFGPEIIEVLLTTVYICMLIILSLFVALFSEDQCFVHCICAGYNFVISSFEKWFIYEGYFSDKLISLLTGLDGVFWFTSSGAIRCTTGTHSS